MTTTRCVWTRIRDTEISCGARCSNGWDALHPQNRPVQDVRALERFKKDLYDYDDVYVCRGEVKQALLSANKPTVYDRVALMAVSVFHLAHWRPDVTVKNYMI